MNSRAQGFSLAELLVVTLVGSIILGAVFQTMTVQERANRQQMAIVTTQQNTRMGMDVMMNELRELSASDNDIVSATGTSIRFRALQKAGVVCDKDYANNDRAIVAYYGTGFSNGDSVVIFRDNSTGSGLDDDWTVLRVNNTPENQQCATLISGMSYQRIQFQGVTPLIAVDSGALVRSFRIIEYDLNDVGTGAVLRRSDIMGSSTAIIAENLASSANQGLRLRYFNAAGTEITPTTQTLRKQIMRIEIKVRGQAVGGQTGTNRMFSDSLVNQVFLRGNYKTS